MIAAIQKARATLPLFWSAMENAPNAANFSLKVAVPTNDVGAEHIWMNAPRKLGDGRYVGIVANEPIHAELSYGAAHEFSEDAITDWVFIRNGLIEGGYTIRAMLDHMDEDDAKAMRAQLAPLHEL